MAQNFMKTFSQGVIERRVAYCRGGGCIARPPPNTNYLNVTSPQLKAQLPKYVCSVPYNTSNFQMSGRRCAYRRKRTIRIRRQIARSNRQVRDVLFLLDQSGSVGDVNFKEKLTFVKETISKLCDKIEISESQSRVAIASFDEKVHVHMNFDEHFERKDVLKVIEKIKYSGSTDGRTCLIEALQYARESMFTTAHGARESKDIYNMIILVTDGCANCQGDLKSALKTELWEFEKQDITFMLVTIGDKTSCSNTISSFANGNHCFLNFEMTSWADFRTFVGGIKDNKQCFKEWTVPDKTCNKQ